MKNLWSKLNGHKTQVMSIITLIIGYLLVNGYIAQNLSDLILGICGILLIGTIGHGIKKTGLLKTEVKKKD